MIGRRPAFDRVSNLRELTTQSVFARPRKVDELGQCDFYHAVVVPGHGLVQGEMDLRGRESAYLGRVDFSGKRILEIGTASGFLTFYMEAQGAEVISFDLSEDYSWDVVPYSRIDYPQILRQRKEGIRRVNNSYWLCHRAFNSEARMVYGSAYDVPREIGPVDITTFCTVLVHLENPFWALRNTLPLTREKVIVTEFIWRPFLPSFLFSLAARPSMIFLPDYRTSELWDTWWFLSPSVVRAILGVLGFEDSRVTYHLQRYRGRRSLCYTVVAQRSRPWRQEALGTEGPAGAA